VKPLLLAAVAATVLATAIHAATSFFSPPRELTYYGHVTAVKRVGARFEVRFDPALWLSGETANRAAAEDKVVPAGEPVPNDYYVREDGHRLLTFFAAPTARATVLTFSGNILSTRVPLSELAEIVKGRNPRKRRLYEPKNGYWIRVAGDRVLSLDQQYTP
jgi:hypothetical protein